MNSPFCYGDNGRTFCDTNPDRFRVDRDGSIRKRPPLPPGTAYWNIRKYGDYCRHHAEIASAIVKGRLAS